MKAAVLYGREDVRVESVEVPEVGPGELLLRTQVALTCGTDVKVYKRGYHAQMIRPPALFGHEVAGIVEAVGEGVTLPPGARVTLANSAPCGVCSYCRTGAESLCDDLLFWNGAYAEFARIPARVVARNVLPLDDHLSFRQAALVEPLACVVRGIDECSIAPGQTVAVIGAGPIGLMLVRLARLKGAHVLSVGRNRGRLQRACELGAEETVVADDAVDLGDRLRHLGPSGQGPDVVIEAAGVPETAEAAIRGVRKGGTVNLFAGCPAHTRIAFDAQRMHYSQLTIRSTFHHTPESIRRAYRLIADGLVDPDRFITDEATLDEVPTVLRRLARGRDGLKTAIRTWGAE